MKPRHGTAPWVKPVVLVLCAVPAVWLWFAGFTDRLGANPAEALIRGLGDWTLRLLCLTLLVTPLRQAFGLAALATWRRGLGLWTFAYASQHLWAYAWLDTGLDGAELLRDVWERPFIAVGLLAWLLLLPLAATSFPRAIRALGAVRWRRLHRAVYVVAGLAVLHFYWMRTGKNHFGEVYLYGTVLAGALAWRVWRGWADQRATLRRAPR
ncbi:sulfite oxidase heme-binding subunit YedZ [Aquabacterium sp. A08]|uniref:sulfite oxidase heme-binding subunit YedZ n=1 Tax=Aquabacterium sp. A08 TaxID=2718532 RepID=UPI001423227B|nr:protein-methionine-sulfoxide reductase heme-binding subunit MsrQ [Aquabacterium sp. A08]NIC42455.1 sulfoxide reductase heme-binding subunit YedZ [Aquabacterium sp. A08]NIC42494.1 sulfoxide reductase heme-binding subunit YedZ [Aquabacterium sp. A08]